MLLVTQKIKEGSHVTKKHNIITTATHLFATQGFDGTTTIQISKDADATEPLLYYHFTGKDEILTLRLYIRLFRISNLWMFEVLHNSIGHLLKFSQMRQCFAF